MLLSDDQRTLARRELVLASTALVAISRLVAGDASFVVAGLLPAVALLTGIGVVGGDEARGRPYEALLVPAVLVGGAGAAIHLVPAGLGLMPALLVFALGLDRVVALEMRLLVQPVATSDGDRARILLAAVVAGFVAFVGLAALVPNGLAEPGALGSTAGGSAPLAESWLVVLALDDALIALLLGYRLAALRYGTAVDAVRSAVTYAIVVAIAAGAVRAVGMPRLLGPAVLILVLYLWDALHGTAPARRREPRFLWETILLVALGVVVVAWNLRLRAG